ncbi:ricin-type beta-trefoil lectin domain protein [Streptomyces sp. 8N706]|uniref:ricin-type beta-trefoil lectin domain protein n=1 Tax=Streptomyces sp. 8N706 TaxID=3457416 RepID=UPI003FD20130
MPEFHLTEHSPAAEQVTYADLPDAELTERVRAGAPTADPAMKELRRRHLPTVLSYARLCSRNQTAGNQLAAQAFALAWPEVRRGFDPLGTWRHHLLMLVQQAAATRAAGSLRDRLDSDFAAWLDAIANAADGAPQGPEGSSAWRLRLQERSTMLGAYYSLPQPLQGVLWYAVVEGESDAAVATLLGIEAPTVSDLRVKAQAAMRSAYLRTYLQRNDDRNCQGFRRLIEAAVRPVSPRRSDDLDRHTAECPHCNLALVELLGMKENPRAVLADGLLGWGGAAYVAAGAAPVPPPAEPAASAYGSSFTVELPVTAPAPERANVPATPGRWQWMTRPVPLAVTAGGVVTALLIAVLVTGFGDPDPAGAGVAPQRPPAATVTETTAVPAPSASRTAATAPSASRTAATAPSASRTAATAPSEEGTGTAASGSPAPGDSFSEVVNVSSGLCLDVEDGDVEKRNDVVTAPCDGAPTQQWRLDPRGLLRNFADEEFCLDSRGDTDKGVGIWPCSSADGDNGENLTFVIDRTGVIRPVIALDHALTPDEDLPVGELEWRPVSDEPDQRWNAGSAATD